MSLFGITGKVDATGRVGSDALGPNLVCQGEGRDPMGCCRRGKGPHGLQGHFMNSMRKSEQPAGGFPSRKVYAKLAINEFHETAQA